MIKGTPPFSRELTRRDFLTQSSAGLGPELRRARRRPLLRCGSYTVLRTPGTVWLIVGPGKSLRAGIRLVSEPNDFTKVTARRTKGGLEVRAIGAGGKYISRVELGAEDHPAVHVRTTLVPAKQMKRETAARDLCLMDSRFEPLEEGLVYTNQTGPTAGMAFASAWGTFVFYFQNLTTLGPYARQIGTTLEGCVGIDWPEMGIKLPGGDKPLAAGQEVVLSDGFLRFNPVSVDSEAAVSLRYIDDLYATYLSIPRPDPEWFDWSKVAAATLSDLSHCKPCSRKVRGCTFFNAYVGSTDKPPESMVQAALMVPMLEYETWRGKSIPLVKKLDGAMAAFFDEKLQCPVRWLPGGKFLKAEPGEEEVPGRIDSWYLFHTLMNIGRLAALGKPGEREIFLSSLAYAIRTARHFKYEWPVFFDLETLAVHKEETQDGHGGEQDVPGLYAHVMLQAWELTREPVYLQEAETAAAKLQSLGFGVLYQTNNTMFGAVALARLWKETGNALYKDLSFVCIGSILSHLWLWEPDVEGRTWRTFMGLPPLHDAPYIAAYEEAEMFATIPAYLDALGEHATESITGLLVEYARHLLDRGRFYMPGQLDPGWVATDPKEGQVDRRLAIPVEDLYPSGEKAGQVGQEVYGAAMAMILTTGCYHHWKGVPFQVWCNAPLTGAEYQEGESKDGSLCFRITGSPECRYDLRIIRSRKPVDLKVRGKKPLRAASTPEEHELYHPAGGEQVTIRWQRG